MEKAPKIKEIIGPKKCPDNIKNANNNDVTADISSLFFKSFEALLLISMQYILSYLKPLNIR